MRGRFLGPGTTSGPSSRAHASETPRDTEDVLPSCGRPGCSAPYPRWKLLRPRVAPQLGRSLLLATLLAASAGAAPPAPAPGDVVFRAPALGIRTLDLPSGMRIVLEEDHTQPVAGVASVVDCGSVQDPLGREGLAHLVEHLTFRARPDGKLQLGNLLDFAGAGSRNAGTDHDLTTYYEVGPREALAELLRLEGTRLARPLAGIDAEVFEAEREVVRNELLELDENGVVTAARGALGSALYPPGHPYARSVLGSEATLWTMTLADAEAFVRKCYQPSNYTIVISGDFDSIAVGAALDATFPPAFLAAPPTGPLKRAPRLDPVAAPPPDPPPDDGIHWVKARSDMPALYVGWTLPRGFDADGLAESFLSSALQSVAMASGDEDIVTTKTSLSRGKFGSTLVLVAVLRTGADPKGSAGHLVHAVTGLEHLSKRWFERSRAAAVVKLAATTDSLEDRILEEARLVHLTGDPLTYRRELEAIDKLQRDKLEATAWTWLSPKRARVVFLKPDDWEAAGRDVGGSPHVLAPSDDIPVHLAPTALATYVHAPSATMRSIVLDTGLEVILVKKLGATASVTVALKSGSATATPLGAATLADALSFNRGFYDPLAWGIAIWTETEIDTTVVEAVGASGNIENVLDGVAEQLTGLGIRERLPSSWEKSTLPLVKEFEQKSGARGERALFESTFADSSYRRTPLAEDYQKLTPSDAKGWVERAYRPQNAVAVIVSDLDLSESDRLARKAFASWKGTSAPPDAPYVAPEMKIGPLRTFRVERPSAKQTELLLGCAARPTDARDAIALELLGARLRSRLESFARGRSGGTYGVAGGTRISRRLSRIKLSSLIDDRNLTRVLALARKELEELGSLRLAGDELDRLKWHLGLTKTVAYGGSAELGAWVAEIRAADLPLALVERFPEFLAEVSAEDVARMATACRATASLGLVGDPAIIDKAFRATQLATSGPSPR